MMIKSLKKILIFLWLAIGLVELDSNFRFLVAAAQPVSQQRQAIFLAGVTNARDIGGYTTIYGKKIRKRVIFRSAELQSITSLGEEQLKQYQTRYIIDLRSEVEKIIHPDPNIIGIKNISNPIIRINNINNINVLTNLENMYLNFVINPSIVAAFAKAVRFIINTPYPTLYHCAAGKDRTGWLTIIIYTILGLDKATIVNDYLLSNKFWGVNENDRHGVKLSYLNIAFRAVHYKYVNMDNYIKNGLGITAAEIKTLKAKMLENFYNK